MAGNLARFESYLQDCHARDYVGIDDDMPDDFDRFMEEMDVEDIIMYAERFSRKEYERGLSDGTRTALAAIDKAFGIHERKEDVVRVVCVHACKKGGGS